MPDPNAEASMKGINHSQIARVWPNILQEWPHPIMAQGVTQTELDQCAGACLIPICGTDPSAEASAQGIESN
jgi:hypothetical protein